MSDNKGTHNHIKTMSKTVLFNNYKAKYTHNTEIRKCVYSYLGVNKDLVAVMVGFEGPSTTASVYMERDMK